MFKFSLATLLFLVLLAAVGCAALVNVNDLWRQFMVTAAAAALLIATLAVAADRSRVFTVGFAIAGWIYLLLVFVPAIGLRENLLTDKAVRELFSLLHEDETPPPQLRRTAVFTPDGRTIVTGSTDGSPRWYSVLRATGDPRHDYENFADVGHSLWVMIVGFLGGTLASFLTRKRNKA